MPIVFPKKKVLVSEKKCSKCGKVVEARTHEKCPNCGGPIVVVTKVKYERQGVTPQVLSLNRSELPELRQGDLVKDFGFPDVNEEIRRAKERKGR